MVCKAPLQSEHKMSSASAYIDRARSMARFIDDHTVREVGDLEIARERLGRRYRIASSILHSLRYRPPKTVSSLNALLIGCALRGSRDRSCSMISDTILVFPTTFHRLFVAFDMIVAEQGIRTALLLLAVSGVILSITAGL
jgi:hypothetical protein